MACNVSVEKILELIGHLGSEIEWPELQEPFCRRTFHTQECIWAAHKLGFSVTPFELIPQLAADPEHIITIPRNFDIIELLKGWGVITGVVKASQKRHAIAYCESDGYDPNGILIDIENQFDIETIWSFDLIL
jgi:hypothetical protein